MIPFGYLEEFILFLRQWQLHLPSIVISILCWLPIVVHLLKTKHATLKKDGETDDIVCGDSRVWGLLVIFGGSAGLSFGLPYYWLMNLLHLSGWFKEYWSGFIYLQFVLSALQTAILLMYAVAAPRNKWWRFLKAHFKGCGWVTGQSPVMWITYWFQYKTPNKGKFFWWLLRDADTLVVFVLSLMSGPLLGVCLLASIFGTLRYRKVNLLIPLIWGVDQDHKDDEDSRGD